MSLPFVFLAAQEMDACEYVMGIAEHDGTPYLTVSTGIFPGSVFVTGSTVNILKTVKEELGNISVEAVSCYGAALFIHRSLLNGEDYVSDSRHKHTPPSAGERVKQVQESFTGGNVFLTDIVEQEKVLSLFSA